MKRFIEPGFMAAKILLDMTQEYLAAFTREGRYIGDPHYLRVENSLKKYLGIE